MYESYYGLKEKPFSIAPDPRYLYMSELHREALAHLLYGISSDGCFILLTGDVGTGKTTVCRCLLQQLPDNTDVALIVNPRLTSLELLESICDELGIPAGDGERSAKFYFDRLNAFLLDAHAAGRNVALLIDEAQNMSLELLEQLRLLTNLETDQKKLLKIVLLGQTELRQKIAQEGAEQISQRITSRYHLMPLEEDDVHAYISHRLAVAGERDRVFSNRALSRIFELSSGIPRLVNVLCDRALLGAYVENKYLVDTKIVEQAGREVFGEVAERKPAKKKRRMVPILIFLFLFLLAASSAFLYWSQKQFVDSQLQQLVEKTVVSSAAEQTPVRETPTPVEQAASEKKIEPETQKSSTVNIIPLEIN
jgi:general secretion pathway protein A